MFDYVISSRKCCLLRPFLGWVAPLDGDPTASLEHEDDKSLPLVHQGTRSDQILESLPWTIDGRPDFLEKAKNIVEASRRGYMEAFHLFDMLFRV